MKVICTAKECLDSSRVIDDNDLELIFGGYLIPGALLGAFSGAAAYTAQAVIANNFSTGKFVTATATGAAAGFVGGPVTAARSIWQINVAIGGGVVAGVAEARESAPKNDTSYWSDFSWEPSGSAFSSSGGDAVCGHTW